MEKIDNITQLHNLYYRQENLFSNKTFDFNVVLNVVGTYSTQNSSLPTSNNSTYIFNKTYNTNNLLFPLIKLYLQIVFTQCFITVIVPLFPRFLIILYVKFVIKIPLLFQKTQQFYKYVHYFLINIILSSLFKIEHIKHLQCKMQKSKLKKMKICGSQFNKTLNYILCLYSISSNFLSSVCPNKNNFQFSSNSKIIS